MRDAAPMVSLAKIITMMLMTMKDDAIIYALCHAMPISERELRHYDGAEPLPRRLIDERLRI